MNKKGNYTLYHIVHRDTGKTYVGITCRGRNSKELLRTAEHFMYAKRAVNRYDKTPTIFQRDMMKFGRDAFDEVIKFEGLSQEDALSLERDQVESLDTFSGFGYNGNCGGSAGSLGSRDGHLVEGILHKSERNYIESLSKKSGITERTLRSRIGKGQTGDSLIRPEGVHHKAFLSSKVTDIPCICPFDLTLGPLGEYVEELLQPVIVKGVEYRTGIEYLRVAVRSGEKVKTKFTSQWPKLHFRQIFGDEKVVSSSSVVINRRPTLLTLLGLAISRCKVNNK